MKKSTIVIICLVIALLVFGVFYFNNMSNKSTDNTPITETSSVKGCYIAKLSKDVYTLNLQSEENGTITGVLAYNNYQKDSSSGIFSGTMSSDVLMGNYSFDSEGMHSDRQVIFKKVGNDFIEGFGPAKVVGGKEVFSTPLKITYDPKSTFIKSDNCIEHFADTSNTFTFDYNSLFMANEGDKTSTLDWKLNAKNKGLLLTSVSIPKTYAPKTNFSGARLTIGKSSDPNEIKNCVVPSKVTVSGYPFKKFTFSDAGAGNIYDTTSYRGIIDGDCYAVEYTIHSSNIGNYSPDQGITEFDKSKIQNELENIVKSFKSLINSN